MSTVHIDPNIIQVGLDSGALTMLGAIVQRFEVPGHYRGTVRRGHAAERIFYVSVDKESPVAAADIDLAQFTESQPRHAGAVERCCPEKVETQFSVNPRGYVLFRVSRGKGGYSVTLRRAVDDDKITAFDSTVLDDGAVFSARILRPGRYVVSNTLGRTRAQLTVAYPPKAFSGYRPPDPERIEVTKKGFNPGKIALKTAQGAIFECRTPARIVIQLEEADDGSGKDGR